MSEDILALEIHELVTARKFFSYRFLLQVSEYVMNKNERVFPCDTFVRTWVYFCKQSESEVNKGGKTKGIGGRG